MVLVSPFTVIFLINLNVGALRYFFALPFPPTQPTRRGKEQEKREHTDQGKNQLRTRRFGKNISKKCFLIKRERSLFLTKVCLSESFLPSDRLKTINSIISAANNIAMPHLRHIKILRLCKAVSFYFLKAISLELFDIAPI
ncbi:hypothetical protein AVM71_16510 (plasmid) [Piscirickettsia salmonis]|nr:hypothetical protein AVM71_16510 [Piscirickettsia salmonis]